MSSENTAMSASLPPPATLSDPPRSRCTLMITDDEWQAFDRFEVPQPEQEELKAVVESTKEAIVVAPFEEGPAPRRVERGSPRRRCPGGAPFGGVRLVASCELCQRGGR